MLGDALVVALIIGTVVVSLVFCRLLRKITEMVSYILSEQDKIKEMYTDIEQNQLLAQHGKIEEEKPVEKKHPYMTKEGLYNYPAMRKIKNGEDSE